MFPLLFAQVKPTLQERLPGVGYWPSLLSHNAIGMSTLLFG
jgi:hypothetical protein